MKKITLMLTLVFSVFVGAQTFNGTGGAIPDNSCGTDHEFPVTVSGIGVLGMTNVLDNIALDITHTFDGDLDIYIVAPNGTVVELSTDNGSYGDNYTGTVFSASVSTLITSGTAPFTGTYKPEGDLSTLMGVDADGTWILRVCDDASGDVGTLNSWSISFTATPTCVEPNQLTSSNITAYSVQLDWNDPSGSQFDFEYLILPTGSATPDDTTSGIYVGNLTVTDSSLTPATTYDAYVRAYCSTSDQSIWVGPITFTTACVAVSEFSEYFDGVTTPNLPLCWSKILSGSSLSTYAYVETVTTNYSAPNGVSLYNSSSDSSTNIMLVSPELSNLGAGTHRLKFEGRNSTASQDIEIGTLTDPTDPATFTVLETVDLTTSFDEYIVDFSNYSGTDTYIGFRRLSTSTYTYVYLDNIIWETIPTSAPSCATNVFATVDNCGNFATVISWDAALEAEGYKITIGTTSGGNDIVDNQDLGNELDYSYIGALNTTYYFTVVPYNVVGDAVSCSEQTFTTSPNGCYCMPSSTSTSTYINNFTATGNAGTDISNLESGYTTGGYADNSASMNLVAYSGLTFDFNAEIVGGTVGCSIWIDWNGDYSFDSTERVYNTTAYGNGPFSGTITIPSSVANGDYRMRVLIHYNSLNPSDPCASNGRLEAEDYTLTVQTASCSPATIESTNIVADCANDQYNIDFDVTDLGDSTPSITDGTNSWPVAIGTVTVGPFASGSTVSLTLLHGSNSLCDLSLGDITYTCPPANDECSDAISLTVGGIFEDYPVDGTNSSATASSSEISPTGCYGYSGGDVWFTATVPSSGNLTIETGVPSVGSGIDTVVTAYTGSCGSLSEVGCDDDGAGNGYSIIELTGLTSGETVYVRVYEYNNDNTGGFAVSAYDASLSNSDFGVENFKAYPNPVKDILNLEYSSEITEVRVINLLGQEVLVQKSNATSVQVNMSALASGTYIVNIQMEGVIKTLKFVKE